jgi:hypothetical protein
MVFEMFQHSDPKPPSPTFSARGRVRTCEYDQLMPHAQCGTSPLAGEVGRGGYMLLPNS